MQEKYLPSPLLAARENFAVPIVFTIYRAILEAHNDKTSMTNRSVHELLNLNSRNLYCKNLIIILDKVFVIW